MVIMNNILERWFRVRERGSTLRVEILGGITTFATMAYIIVVNPAILEKAGIPIAPSTIATILASVCGCLLMGFYANRPIAVAPYMGENAFIAYTLALGGGFGWQPLLGAVFLAGTLFCVLTLLGLRRWLAEAVPANLKHAFAIGIGLFLLFIGMYETGIVESPAHSPPPLIIGKFGDLKVQLAVAGFFLMAVLLYWNVRGALLIGIAVIALAGYLLGVGEAPAGIVAWPAGIGEVALQLDILAALRFDFLTILLTLFLISFLDTLGTLYALGSAAGMLDKQGNLAEIEKPMLVDSLSCMSSALLGTTTSGAFIESATGIREGARTGIAAVVTGLLFLLALFFVPLLQPLQQLKFAYGPALMIVGVMMFAAVRRLETEDLTELIPALATIVMMVFTYNIANGLTAGLILYPLLKLSTGHWRTLHAGTAILGGLCLLYYLFGKLH
jgi:AGZA family xanthine/uracil permease-like MFS transporter